MSKTFTSGLTPSADLDTPQNSAPRESKSAVAPTVLASRLSHLSDELTWLVHAVPENDQESRSELLRACDAIKFAAKRLQPLK